MSLHIIAIDETQADIISYHIAPNSGIPCERTTASSAMRGSRAFSTRLQIQFGGIVVDIECYVDKPYLTILHHSPEHPREWTPDGSDTNLALFKELCREAHRRPERLSVSKLTQTAQEINTQ